MNLKLGILITTFLFSCDHIVHDTVKVGIISELFPETLDPARSVNFYDYIVYSSIYETLLKIDTDNKTLMSNLAVSWKISDNQKKFFLKLRPNVFFHDDTKLRASSVKESYNWTIKNNPSNSLLRMIESIEIIDSLSLNINLQDAYAPFLYVLASPYGLNIYSENALKEYGDSVSKHPVGTGPFYLNDWNHEGIILCFFSKYWKNIAKKYEIIFKPYLEIHGPSEALRDELVDISFPVSGYVADRLMWSGLINYKILHTDNIVYLGFNTKNLPFNDLRVRKAVLKAIRIKNYVFGFQRGNSIVAGSPVPPGLLECKHIKKDSYHLVEARSLLDKAGYKSGLKLNLFTSKPSSGRQTIFEFLKTDLAKIGIKVNIISFDSWKEFIQAVKSDSCHLFLDTWTNELFGDAENFLYSLFSKKSENNLLNYDNPKVEALLAQAALEPDRDKRRQLYCQIVQIILDDVPAVFLYHVKQHFAYNKKRIKYLPVDPYGVIQFHQIVLN